MTKRTTMKDYCVENIALLHGAMTNEQRAGLKRLTENDLCWLKDYIGAAVFKAYSLGAKMGATHANPCWCQSDEERIGPEHLDECPWKDPNYSDE